MSHTPPTEPPVYSDRPGTAPARCKQCFYVIENLPDKRCPECGRAFDPAVPDTYTFNPPQVIVYWHWGLALLIASVVALATSGALLAAGSWGYALWVGVPMGSAVILGYAVRPAIVGWLLGIVALGVIIITMFMAMNIAGLFCGAILAIVIVLPLLCGVAVGAGLRLALKHNALEHARRVSIGLALGIPIAWGLIEGRPVPMAHESIVTTRIINAPVDVAWDSMMFYEEVEHTPPLILRIGLAHPLVTSGSSQRVGDIKTCYYNKGHITKQVTQVQEHERLAFAIIEQNIGYERDVRLTGGNFAFEAVNEHQTRITLTTHYEPLLSPRFMWRWGDRYAVHTLHNHVMEGMARKAQQPTELPQVDAVVLRRADAVDR